MTKKDEPEDEKIDDYLKRLDLESSEKKREEAFKILHRAQPKQPVFSTWWQPLRIKMAASFEDKRKEFLRQVKYSENKHLMIITVFFLGAIWMSWKIEDKYDRLRDRANSTKSLKTRQIETENDHIQKMLARNPFEPVPIEEEETEVPDYTFQKADI